MQSFLISGGSLQERTDYIQNWLAELKISQFDQFSLTVEKSIKIEQVRQLTTNLYKKPLKSPMRAGIIYEAEKATTEAQNALLKLLEEPPKTVCLFLSTPNPENLLGTIVSRCKIIKLLKTKSLDKKEEENLKIIFDKLNSQQQSSTGEKFKLAEDLARDRQSADQFLQNGLIYIRTQYLKVADSKTISRLSGIAKNFQLARKILSANVNPRQVLENLFLNLE